MRPPLAAAIVALGLSWPGAGAVAAQGSETLYPRLNALSGWELRGYAFDSGLAVKSVSQWHVPIVVAAPFGRRLSVDLTTHLASGHIRLQSGESETLTGLTDTQLRLLYTLGRDRAVASVSVNLPTGRQSVSTSEFQVNGAVGANYLSFPVSNFGTAFGVTGGLALARPLGRWNLGVSGSVRYLGSYEPFTDQAVGYSPGLEMRVRAGLDRLLGERGRVLVGLTVSSFGTDEFTGTGTMTAATYRPGLRFVGELAVARLMGRSTLGFAVWNFHRLAGDTNDVASPGTAENVLNAELRLSHPLSPRVTLEPMASYRQWNPGDVLGGRLGSVGLTARLGFSERWSGSLGGRFDTGWVFSPGRGRADLIGYGVTALLRYQR